MIADETERKRTAGTGPRVVMTVSAAACDIGVSGPRRRMGFEVFSRRERYDIVWCFLEIEGLLLALLLKMFRIRRLPFLVGAETLSPKALFLFRGIRVWTRSTVILPLSSRQAQELCRIARAPDSEVLALPHQGDCEFFSGGHARKDDTGREYVVAVGGYSLDYPTVIAAMGDIDADLVTAACGSLARREALLALRESPYRKGITALEEAMAVGLPVIVTRTVGRGDVAISGERSIRLARTAWEGQPIDVPVLTGGTRARSARVGAVRGPSTRHDRGVS